MNRFLLDTNVVLAYLRRHVLFEQIEKDHQLSSPDSVILISVVTKAELMSLGTQLNWGEKKLNKLINLLNKLIIIDVNEADKTLLEAYSKIDAFSQNRLEGNPLNNSARNMGKNDLWIAATAHVTNSTLITTDADFDHLHGQFIILERYQVPTKDN